MNLHTFIPPITQYQIRYTYNFRKRPYEKKDDCCYFFPYDFVMVTLSQNEERVFSNLDDVAKVGHKKINTAY